jgi:hypothetical protein
MEHRLQPHCAHTTVTQRKTIKTSSLWGKHNRKVRFAHHKSPKTPLPAEYAVKISLGVHTRGHVYNLTCLVSVLPWLFVSGSIYNCTSWSVIITHYCTAGSAVGDVRCATAARSTCSTTPLASRFKPASVAVRPLPVALPILCALLLRLRTRSAPT